MKKEEFLDMVSAEIKAAGIELVISPDKYVISDNTPCSGYFDENEKKMVVATGNDAEWFHVFVHEYCHFLQWKEGWQPFFNYDCDEVDILWEICSGHDVSVEYALKGKEIVLQVEHDCERRVIEHINKYDLPIDRILYAKKANAYLYMHHAGVKYRGWNKPGFPAYTNEKILAIMPDYLDDNYENCPESIVDFIAREVELI